MRLSNSLIAWTATTAVVVLVVLGAPLRAQTTAETSAEATAGAVERELVVRFTRAYGMAKQAFEAHPEGAPSSAERDAMLRKPDELKPELRRELMQILELNGLERGEWKMMFARMDADEALRQRVESLSTVFE